MTAPGTVAVSTLTAQMSVSAAVAECITGGLSLLVLDATVDEIAAATDVPVDQVSPNIARLQLPACMVLVECLARNAGTELGRRVTTAWSTDDTDDGRRRRRATFHVGGPL